jgi:hypothetical protein
MHTATSQPDRREENPAMKAIRRIGKTPTERGDTTGMSGSLIFWSWTMGSFAVIGVDITEELGRRPLADARCADNERIIRITRGTLIAAKPDIPEE